MKRPAFTLLELLVVLTILVALAGLMVPLLGTTAQSAELDTTYQTMQAIRDAIMGTPTVAGYFPDMKGGPPVTVSRLVAAQNSGADTVGLPDTLADLLTNPGVTMGNGLAFDPQIRKGWRGPYLSQSAGASLGTVLDSFPLIDPVTKRVLAPGSPIIIEWPTSATGGSISSANWSNYVRLRSFGPDGKRFTALDTSWDPTTLAAAASSGTGPQTWGDDLILYIRRDVPGMDWTNYWDMRNRLASR